MKPDTYDFRQFQEELAALDRKSNTLGKEKIEPTQESAHARLLQAQEEFMALRKRHGLTVAHVVAFFPEEEGVAYLQKLIADQEAKPKRRSKSSKRPSIDLSPS